MSQGYSDPRRESDPHALPNVEVYYLSGNIAETAAQADAGDFPEPGWYWQACFPGCLPDGDPSGPFEIEAEALADCRESSGLCPHGASDEETCALCDSAADERMFVIRGTPRGANNGRFACYVTDELAGAAKWILAKYAQSDLERRGWLTDQWEVVSVAQVKRESQEGTNNE